MELLFVFAMILIVLYYFYQKRLKTHFPTILYQDHKKHVLSYKKINPNNKQPQDLQYTTYLLSLINELPQDEFILIYACLKKWEKQEEIALEEKEGELNIHFHKTYTNNLVEDQLFQMLYCLEIDHIVENEVIRKWVEVDFDKILEWKNAYLKDIQNKLKQEHKFVDGRYSLEIYQDLEKVLGYKKYLDAYKEIETEEENIYAMLFGLKECPYHMYTFFIMKNDDDKPMINSSLK